MKEYIILKDKEVVSLNEILVGFPYKMLVFNGEFIKFCHYVANRDERLDGDLIKVYCNLLFLKSKRIKILYRLYELDRAGKLKEIHIEFISRKKFGYLFSESTLISKEDSNGNLLPYQSIPKLFLKYFGNKLFYLFKAKIKNTKIVKSWVEISERIYKDELNEAQILIYPFPLKLYRQFKYISTKIRNSKKFGLMGVPYRISPILKALFNKNIDYHITVFEYTGAIKHARYYIEQQSVKEIFTTEEFEVGSYVFSRELIQNGKVVTNTCHGLSVYSPFVYYSTFHLINKKQKELYSIFNSSLDFEILYPEEYKSNDSKVTKVIYIDQGNLRSFGLDYEAELRSRALEILNKVGQNRKSQIEVKIHPNTKQKEINELRSNYKFLTIIKNLKPNEGGIVFITLYSTAYYDFRKFGNFLFIEDDLFNPSHFFGSNIDKVHISNLKHKTEDLLSNG